LKYGAGDPRWFDRLDRDEQIDVLAHEQVVRAEQERAAARRERRPR